MLKVVSRGAREVHGVELAGDDANLVQRAGKPAADFLHHSAGQKRLELIAGSSGVHHYRQNAVTVALQRGMVADRPGNALVPYPRELTKLANALSQNVFHQQLKGLADRNGRAAKLPLLPDGAKLSVIHDGCFRTTRPRFYLMESIYRQ